MTGRAVSCALPCSGILAGEDLPGPGDQAVPEHGSPVRVAHQQAVRRGKEAVAAFFADHGSAMEVDEFTPLSFAANDTGVLTVVRFRAHARATGKAAEMNLHHFFTFRDGKIAYYRGTEDTAQTEAVLRA